MKIKRLPVIRHIRWLVLTLRFDQWWRNVGRHLGVAPNPADLLFLDKVWEGRA